MSGEPDPNTPIRLTVGSLRMITGDMAKTTGEYVREVTAAVTAPLERRLQELTARLSQLEGAKYAGVWRDSMSYAEGASVTHRNGLWYARAPSRGVRPGTSKDWQLASRGGIGED